ncbi:MAG: class I SAM-dependent methyltransferase [Deltaproteobacteria bacterium]|nr:class I SAM-dependent methyltransferase [Deltaproteobacteria bacterium]
MNTGRGSSLAPDQLGRRLGDAISIPGDYQHRALTEGPSVQRYWHKAKLELLDWIFTATKGERVLDVGCGSGVLADKLASQGADVLGIDANPSAIEYATRAFGRAGLEFRLGYLDELQLETASFDKAACLEVVEHVYPNQVRELLADLRRVLKPGGELLITTPNYRGLWPVVEWLADRFATTARMDGDQHVTRFHRATLRDALLQAGFEVMRLQSYSTLAPFLAAVTWKGAEVLDRLERRADLPLGNLLVAVARNPR